MKKPRVKSGRNGTHWLRSWRSKLHSPKVRRLTPEQYQTWDLLLCMTDRAGTLPPMADIAYHLRAIECEARKRVLDLVELRFIDIIGDARSPSYRMHDWDVWQSKYAASTARVRKHRKQRSECHETLTKRSRNTSESVSVSSTKSEDTAERSETSVTADHEKNVATDTAPRLTARPADRRKGGRS